MVLLKGSGVIFMLLVSFCHILLDYNNLYIIDKYACGGGLVQTNLFSNLNFMFLAVIRQIL